MVCGVNKVRRADTVQIFSAFGIEMVELPLTALALARTEEKKKDAARKERRSLPQINRSALRRHSCWAAALTRLEKPGRQLEERTCHATK